MNQRCCALAIPEREKVSSAQGIVKVSLNGLMRKGNSSARSDRVNGTQQRRESRAVDIGKRRKNKFAKKRPNR
jgi:hypothetical protein